MNKLIIILIVSFPFLVAGISNAGGSVGGYSSSMGDGNKTCTACHGGGNAIDKNDWISTNIPSTGYIAGQTYTITISGIHSGVSRFGFEATAEDNSGNKVGTIIITNNGETKLINSNKSITHTGNGFTPNGDNKSWDFDWIAPISGTGDITFSSALCAANGNMGTSGDVTYKSSSVITENLSSYIANTNNIYVFISPNPANEIINVKLDKNKYSKYYIIDISGKTLINNDISNEEMAFKIDISNISKGIYFLKLQSNNNTILRKFVKR